MAKKLATFKNSFVKKSKSVKVTPKISTKKEAPVAETTKEKKPVFDFSTAINDDGSAIALDDNGKLTAVPVNWEPKFKSFIRKDFSDPGFIHEWKSYLVDKQIENLQKKKLELAKDATAARQVTSPGKKALRKREKLMTRLTELEEQLKSEGIDFD